MSRSSVTRVRGLAAALLALSLAACGGADAPLTISPASFDFGLVLKGDTREHTFRITNHGDRIVQIKAQPNCGCFGVAQSLRPLDPNSSMDLNVMFSTTTLSAGRIRGKYITIHTDHPELPRIVLPLDGEVYRAYTLRPALFRMNRIDGSEANYEPRTVTILPEDGRTLRFLGHFSMPDVFDVESSGLPGGGLSVSLRLRKAARRPMGRFGAKVRLDLEITTTEGVAQRDHPVVEFQGLWSIGLPTDLPKNPK